MTARDELIEIVTRDPESSGGDRTWATDLVDAHEVEVGAELARLFEDRGRSLLDGGIMTAADAAQLIRQHAAGKDTSGAQAPAGESTQPAHDFFQPEHSYAHANYRFQCLYHVIHPVTREVQAWGWFGKADSDGRRHMSFSRGQWEARSWDDITGGDAR